jgi:hypothetical protein
LFDNFRTIKLRREGVEAMSEKACCGIKIFQTEKGYTAEVEVEDKSCCLPAKSEKKKEKK